MATSITKLIDQVIAWVNKLFGYADTYTASYGKYVLYGMLALIVGQFVKIKFNINTGGK